MTVLQEISSVTDMLHLHRADPVVKGRLHLLSTLLRWNFSPFPENDRFPFVLEKEA